MSGAKLLLLVIFAFAVATVVITECKPSNSRGRGKGYGKVEKYSYLKRRDGMAKLLENQGRNYEKHSKGSKKDGLGIGITVQITELDIMKPLPNTCTGKASGPANKNKGRGRVHEVRAQTNRVLVECTQSQSSKPGKGKKPKKNNGRGRRGKRQALIGQENLWQNGVVYFAFEPNAFAESTKTEIRSAIAEFNNYTCIHFEEGVASTFEAQGQHYVRIVNQGVCTSYVGYFNTVDNTDGYQNLSLAENLADPALSCIQRSIIVHELTHAAGVFHHHTRTDRDSFVTIVQSHVKQGALPYFALQDESVTHSIPYDYTSLLHYERNAFSLSSADTIVTSNPAYQDIIGKSPTLSFNDVKLLSAMYTCSAGCSSAIICPSQGFLGANCQCYCPTGIPENPVKICDEVCTFPGDDCSCSNNPTTACQQISNSQCQAATGKCVCQNGFAEQDGECVSEISISCTIANEFCLCTENGCTQVANSHCDNQTDSCICKAGFYLSAGQCVQIPDCTTVDSDCKCDLQDANACNQLGHTVCNPNNGACVCKPPYSLHGGICIQSPDYLVSDGSQVAPFKDVYDSWKPRQGSDANLLGIPSNNKYLLTNLALNEWDIQYEAQMTADITSGTWCMDMGVMLDNSVLYTEYYLTTTNEWQWQSISSWNDGYYHYTFKFTTSQPTQVRISTGRKADAVQNFWETKIDPLKVYKC